MTRKKLEELLDSENVQLQKQSAEIKESKEYFPETAVELSELTNHQSLEILKQISIIYKETIETLENEDRKILKKLTKEVNLLNKQTKKLKSQSLSIYKNLSFSFLFF